MNPPSETDLLLMTLVIFVPALFALCLCFPGLFPRDKPDRMRWWSLWGTAATMVLSFFLFINYYQMAEGMAQGGRPLHGAEAQLLPRMERALEKQFAAQPRDAQDMLARYPWIPSFNIDYYVGIDGISMPLILLTTVISFLAMLASFPPRLPESGHEHQHHHEKHWSEKYVRGYCILFLLLETGMIGTFLALDFFLFYIFWEVMLLPMYFLIGVWGGPRREYAAIKFFLYTLLGSVFILIALLGFYFANVQDFVNENMVKARADETAKTTGLARTEVNSFDLLVLAKAGQVAAEIIKAQDKLAAAPDAQAQQQAQKELAALFQKYPHTEGQLFFTSRTFQFTMFLLLFVGFAIKVPVFPFHTWLPDAHVEAPTPISMILAGVLLKMGGYGIIRIAYPICPWAAETLATWVALFGVINIVYGAFAAMAQTDFKKLVAYSSVSHMGYVILGIAVWSAPERAQFWSWGMNGAMFQMIAHGITSAGMFFLVGVIYDRAHHRNLDNFRGLYEPMPLYGGISALIFFAALGLPGMCGFVGEFMVILSTWGFSPPGFPDAGKVFAVLAALTVVLTAAYILWTVQRVYLGTNDAYKHFPDITPRELICIVPLVVLSVLLGVLPNLLLGWMEPSVTGLVNTLARVSGW